MLYTLRFFFSSKCRLFHNANLFGSCIIHILYTGCAKIKKKNIFRRQRVKHVDIPPKSQSHSRPSVCTKEFETRWTNFKKIPILWILIHICGSNFGSIGGGKCWSLEVRFYPLFCSHLQLNSHIILWTLITAVSLVSLHTFRSDAHTGRPYACPLF